MANKIVLLFLRSILLISMALLPFGCQNQGKAKAWTYQEMGRFKKVQPEDIPQEQMQRMQSMLNNSKVVRFLIFSPPNDFNAFFSVKSLFSSAGELFYVSDIQEKVKRVRCHMDSKADSRYPLLITTADNRRIKETKITRDQFYTLELEFGEEQIVSKVKTVQKITAEQQQKRIFKPMMEQYQRSSGITMPKTILKREELIPIEKYRAYMSNDVKPEFIDQRFYYYQEGNTDTLFISSPNSRYVLFDKNGRITERALEKKSSFFFQYDSENRISEVKKLDNSLGVEGEAEMKTQMRYHYSDFGLVDSIVHFNSNGKKNRMEVFSYQFQQSHKGVVSASITVATPGGYKEGKWMERKTDVFFDKKMNWIKIKKSNGEINRRISYLK